MRLPHLLFALLASATPVLALDLTHRTVSLSRQFVVYCDDGNARAKIADFAEETKKKLLSLTGQTDHWKYPVVIKVEPASVANRADQASRVQVCQTEDGSKIEVDVKLGANPREIRFEQQIVRALLLELTYRDNPPVAGASYAEPPAWLIEGAVALFHSRESGPDSQVFKSLLNNDHLPRLADFLAGSNEDRDSASRELYSACAMSLVQLLIDLPDGRASLTGLIRHLPRDGGDAIGGLIRNFPTLGATTPSMEKWWALSMARLAASDRFQGLSLEESEQRLAPILSLEIQGSAADEKKTFALDQFQDFRKIAASRAALAQMSANLLALNTQVSPLFRPIVADYQQIAADLARGKTRGMKERIETAAKYRELLLSRIDQIADYLNWFEATQITTQSDSFADYMTTAKAIAHDTTRRSDPIARYLDVVQQQVE